MKRVIKIMLFEKCCGLCILPCVRGNDFEKNSDYAKTWKKEDDGGVIRFVCKNLYQYIYEVIEFKFSMVSCVTVTNQE